MTPNPLPKSPLRRALRAAATALLAGPVVVAGLGATPAGAATTGVDAAAYGARANDAVDDTKALTAALAAAATKGGALTLGPGTYRVNGTLEVPGAVTSITMAPTTVLRQQGDPKRGTLSKKGSLGAAQYGITAGAVRGSSTVKLSTAAGLKVGSWLFLGSSDAFADHKPMQPGHLRRVVAVSGTSVTLDTPLNRTMRTSPRAYVANLAAPLTVTGGAIEHATPTRNYYPLVTLDLVQSPVLAGVELRNGGASGVRVGSTVGGSFDVRIHDLLDDESGKRYGSGRHYGYGIEAVGAARDLRITGQVHTVRHAFTTNAAYQPVDSRIRGMGDPESFKVSLDVRGTTSTGLDTHEPGWAISFAGSTVTDPGRYRAAGSTNGKEGGGGVFIRSRGTVVDGVTITGAYDEGLTVARPAPGAVAWTLAEAPVVRNVRIVGGKGTRAVALHQPATLGAGLVVDSAQQVGVQVNSTAKGAVLSGATIGLRGVKGAIGVHGASYASLNGVSYVGVARPTFG
ncbi:hypothetical protein [Vallicoccus soli]|uniref:hypothetical protein n=1 Tax=Vallicoccus soli TaxID=2339232 RepID=UPI0014036086|nr:hypothetical protein [Vallicoccus soli]